MRKSNGGIGVFGIALGVYLGLIMFKDPDAIAYVFIPTVLVVAVGVFVWMIFDNRRFWKKERQLQAKFDADARIRQIQYEQEQLAEAEEREAERASIRKAQGARRETQSVN